MHREQLPVAQAALVMPVMLQCSSGLIYIAAMARYSTHSRLAQIAADQWGLVTRRQAEQAGVFRATFQRLIAEPSSSGWPTVCTT